MDAGGAAWWPSVIVFGLGLLILAGLMVLVLRRTERTGRELRRWLGSVHTATARLRSGVGAASTARDRVTRSDVGRIAPTPTKGE